MKNKLVPFGISICFMVAMIGAQFRAASAAPTPVKPAAPVKSVAPPVSPPSSSLSGATQSLTQAQALASARIIQPKIGALESTAPLVTERTSAPLIGVVDRSSKLVGVLAYQAAIEAQIRRRNAAPQSPVLAKLPVPEAETLVKRADGTFVLALQSAP